MKRRVGLMVCSLLWLGARSAWAEPKRPPAAEPTAEPVAALVARMQKFYETTRDIHARFEQTVESGTGRRRMAAGEMWLKKPGRMRWEYQKPERKLMVADGETLWVYEPEDQQAFRQSLNTSSLPSSVSFLLGKGKLGDEFTISPEPNAGEGARPGETALRLVPKTTTAQYRYLVFLVDDKTAIVMGTVVHDQQGGLSRMRFTAVEANRGVKDDKFRFTPPSGTKILQP